MPILKPTLPAATAIDVVGIRFHTQREPDTGNITAVRGQVMVTRLDASGNQIGDPVYGTLSDLTATQQGQVAAILASIRTYAINNLLGS
jgi:hypothetical protein